MLLSQPGVSRAALQEENARRKDFFTLLYLAQRRLYSPTNVEWRLMEHCLDDINNKYADFSFLVAFAASLALRNRKGRFFISRYRIPLYLGLVGYDNALRSTNPCPTMTFWNSITLLESPLGETARALHAPSCFYEVKEYPMSNKDVGESYLFWLWDNSKLIVESLFLNSFLRSILDQSCWKQASGDTTVTSLVINTRFSRWYVFSYQKEAYSGQVKHRMKISLPTLSGQLGLRWSYRSREMILERASFGGQLWYGVHFALMWLLGLQDGTRVK
ncbi:hypothetical protein TcG_08977 [Trypanosoma cruzi]|uniref:Uncharacterized protein n=2 Tax=Trypanosoma cruzi TaxID=5693 RepID=V5BFJ3_TRYCR|nr:hypothetical protein TCDM_08997 [Trypanosoma cruzi Dm28c]KAF8278265.1 hypothetical protein TcBrA4_0119420 [Trypanosoma cruzi]PBJ80072.1 hypothetical protein BCY84_02101 [Trypanosoma cruzi cruzi]PWU94511.1 hypothetical protein C4B63_26g196 [Trypanosoma cruzi]RNF11969.1 hypothetical protein TcG_08977 [Trypanosoma cruzi]